jgi:hypothetical protein
MIKKTKSLNKNPAIHAMFFFSFVIVGFAFLSIAKLANISPSLLVMISAGLMATYAFFIIFVPATKLRLDVAGDNMYYLGFLYTLSSLAVAITVSEADQVLGNFGVAITSTILGIAARVAFNQMRSDPHEIEAASRVELSEATRRVTDELGETVLQLTKFRTLSMQVMAEGYEDVQKNVDSAAQEIFKSLKDTSDKNTKILANLSQSSIIEQTKLSASMTNLKRSNEELLTANQAMVSQMVSAAEAYQKLTNQYLDSDIIVSESVKKKSKEKGSSAFTFPDWFKVK